MKVTPLALLAKEALGRCSPNERGPKTYDGMDWCCRCKRSQLNQTSSSEERLRRGGLMCYEISPRAGLLRVEV
jgi:hypothetical protein